MTPVTMKPRPLYITFFLLPSALCHIEMSWPYPFRSKFDPSNNPSDIDYSMTDPLMADGSDFPCKGYQNGGNLTPRTAYNPGSIYNMSLAGSAMHEGGSCQLSLSYDNAATFRVVKSLIGGCPMNSTYNFTIPPYAPAGQALLAWTWQNYEGNREYYMNCAPVQINARTYRTRRYRRDFDSFSNLPYLWKANLKGVNDCSTSEAEDVVYPHPGPDIEYAGGMNSSSPATPGTCDSPLPYGRTYVAIGQGTSSMSTASSSQSTYNVTTAFVGSASSMQMSAMSQSTTTITIEEDCDSTVTLFITSSVYTASATARTSACTATADHRPCAPGYGCQYLGACEWQCVASPTPSTMSTIPTAQPTLTVTYTPTSTSSTYQRTTSTPASNTTSIVITATVSPVSASTPTTSTSSTSSSVPTSPSPSPQDSGASNAAPQYATGDPQAYLPCVPGTFLCTSSTSWLTCNYNDGTASGQPSSGYVYESPRDVAAGMECLPYLSPYSSQQSQYSQQAMAPNGYYRDDRYVRARPDGSCSSEGAFLCTNDGTSFDICDQGGWISMGSVAAGTTCENGQIVAS